jgi:CheY-like chemotaxis protein
MANQTTSQQRILLVDDDADSLDLLAKQLQHAGYIVEATTEPQAALAAIESFGPTVAIIDLGLPIMNGYELAREIRAISTCKLIALSGYGRESAPGDTAVTSFDRHLVKPVDAAALEQTLRTLG